MKKTKGSLLPKNFGRALLLLALGITPALATPPSNTFNYTNGDVMICFRPAIPGGSDLVVDAGPISYFTNLAPNTKVQITAYTGQQLAVVGTNDIAWSAWAFFDIYNTNVPVSAQNTMFMSSPRGDLNTQTDPYYRSTSRGQQPVVATLAGIVAGAVKNGSANINNSSTAVVVPESYNFNNTAFSYYFGLGNNLNFQNFQAQPDQLTGDTFTDDGTPVRSDFYWLPPTPDFNTLPATFLGYFEFSTNGMMTYTAYPSAVTVAPTIVSYVHAGTTNTVTFTTGNSGTYTLRGTDSSGLATARTNWPAINSVSGDGATHALSDVTSDTVKFYVITAQ